MEEHEYFTMLGAFFLVFETVFNVMIEKISLGHLECLSLWTVKKKNHCHIDCYISLGGVYLPTQVIILLYTMGGVMFLILLHLWNGRA